MITNEMVLDALRLAVEKAGSQEKLASSIGVTGSFISLMLSGKRKVPDNVLEFLGFEKIISLRRLK